MRHPPRAASCPPEALLSPPVDIARRNPLAPAGLGDTVFAAQPFQNGPASRALSDQWRSPARSLRLIVASWCAAGCPSRPSRLAPCAFRVSVSSPFPGGYDEPETLRSEIRSDVPQGLMRDMSPMDTSTRAGFGCAAFEDPSSRAHSWIGFPGRPVIIPGQALRRRRTDRAACSAASTRGCFGVSNHSSGCNSRATRTWEIASDKSG